MILLKTRLVFGMVKKAISTVFKFVYKIIKAFNLHLTLFVLLLGLVLAIVGAIPKGSVGLIVFYVAVALSVMYAVVKTVKNVFGIGKKNKRVKIVNQPSPEKAEKTEVPSVKDDGESLEKTVKPVEQPKYYAVKNNPSYVMAEYSDKYELFLKTKDGLKKVRTDYK